MQIKVQPMGPYQTNCYIVTVDNKDFIIDPGVDATTWVKQNTTNPVAVLNTHGHFDHVWSNHEVATQLNIPLYCPQEDAFMLDDDPFEQGTPSSNPDVLVTNDASFDIQGVQVQYHFFPGHTPGCSAIQIGDSLFSGDFIFKGSIGRVDFPYSNSDDMIQSIHKILAWEEDIKIYPGHGMPTSLKEENNSLRNWINYL